MPQAMSSPPSTPELRIADGVATEAGGRFALANFRAGKTRILVATDIAARGIDVEALGHLPWRKTTLRDVSGQQGGLASVPGCADNKLATLDSSLAPGQSWKAALGLERLWDRSVDQLSGGERQRVLIGRALAADAQQNVRTLDTVPKASKISGPGCQRRKALRVSPTRRAYVVHRSCWPREAAPVRDDSS